MMAKRTYHNATAQNFCTRNHWNFRTQQLWRVGWCFSLLNSSLSKWRHSRRQRPLSFSLRGSHRSLCSSHHLLWRMKLFSPLSICQVKTWAGPTSRNSSCFWSTQTTQAALCPWRGGKQGAEKQRLGHQSHAEKSLRQAILDHKH